MALPTCAHSSSLLKIAVFLERASLNRHECKRRRISMSDNPSAECSASSTKTVVVTSCSPSTVFRVFCQKTEKLPFIHHFASPAPNDRPVFSCPLSGQTGLLNRGQFLTKRPPVSPGTIPLGQGKKGKNHGSELRNQESITLALERRGT